MRKNRDYSNLRETAHARDAAKQTSTVLKDYSLQHVIYVGWGQKFLRRRLVRISINEAYVLVRAPDLWAEINSIIDEADEDGRIPRLSRRVETEEGVMELESRTVNEECLRDSMMKMYIGPYLVIIDLEELLRATRYT